jgi:CubicO group peptidase (beta-lactamase class C family)
LRDDARAMRPLAPLAALLVLAACASPPPPAAPKPPPPPIATPAPPPTSEPVAVAPAAQRFAEATPEETFTDPARRTKLAAAFAAIDAAVSAERATQDLPGIAFGIVIDGELVHTAFAGVGDLEKKTPIDADTVFRIGSITKTFTAEALLTLRDEGKLALDDPAARHLPELAGVVYPTRDAAPLTLRQILTHTSGLPRLGPFDYTRPDRDVTEAEMVNPLAGLTLSRAPGVAYEYSNLGVSLLGLVVARAAGAPYRDVIANRLTRPLGMTSAAWDPASVPAGRLATGYAKKKGKPEHPTLWRLGASEGSGGMFLSLRDLARWAAFQLDAWPPRSAPDDGPLRRASRREAHAMEHPIKLHVGARRDARKGEPSIDARADAVGLAWHGTATCELDTIVMHDGAIDGYRASVHFLPKHGVGIVALANDVGADLDRVTDKALAELVRTGGLEARVAPPKASRALEDALATLVRVQNAWDEGTYLGMLTEAHKQRVPPAAEREELAEYQRRHGRCEPGPAVEARASMARFALRCERGRFEMAVSVDDAGKIGGFTGRSWGVDPSPELAHAAAGLASLVNRWSEATYKKLLAPEFKLPKAEVETFYAGLRERHATCGAPKPWEYQSAEAHRFRLECERGGDMEMAVTLAKGTKDHVVGLLFEAAKEGRCPVK